MEFRHVDFGFSTADADQIELKFESAALTLRFLDWREQPIVKTFQDVLAFKWDSVFDESAPRDDQSFEVVDSPWLSREVERREIEDPSQYCHYKLCFNELGVLDVLALAAKH
ncbi:MAG TPA: hypothetical protein VJZ00_06815 [Thermoanaerobaculia bacterium]|nr:hypothetical protein [Thermoanaerobaculia bacterium]